MSFLEGEWPAMELENEADQIARAEGFLVGRGSTKCRRGQYVAVTARNALRRIREKCGRAAYGVAHEAGSKGAAAMVAAEKGVKGLVNVGMVTCCYNS